MGEGRYSTNLCEGGQPCKPSFTIFVTTFATLVNTWPRVRVNAWQSAQMLTDLFKILKTWFLSTQQFYHATQRGPFKHFATIQRIGVFHQSDIFPRYSIDQMACRVHLSHRNFVMVAIIENVHQIRVKWMHILQLWKLGYYRSEFVMKRLLKEFNFARIKSPNSTYLPTLPNNRGSFTLRFRKDDIFKILKVAKSADQLVFYR